MMGEGKSDCIAVQCLFARLARWRGVREGNPLWMSVQRWEQTLNVDCHYFPKGHTDMSSEFEWFELKMNVQ